MDISISCHIRKQVETEISEIGDQSIRQRVLRTGKSTSLLLLLFFMALLLAACNSDKPAIAVEATVFDLGRVVNGQIVSHDLAVRNEGTGDLVVDSLMTSCTCTQATMAPMIIPAGSTGTLHIEFDSGFHGPDLTGPLVRQVFINSNDRQQPELMVEFSVLVEAKTS